MRRIALYLALILTIGFIFIYALFRELGHELINYLLLGGLTLISAISLPTFTHLIYKVGLKRKEYLFWFLFIFNIFMHFGILFSYILFRESIISFVGCGAIVIFLIFASLIRRKNKQVSRTNIIKTGSYGFNIAAITLLAALPIVHLSRVSLVVIGELLVLITILIMPFINLVSKFKVSLNDRMLLTFAREIKYYSP